MKTATLAFVAGLAGVVVAQLPPLPACASSCLTKYTSGGTIAGCNSLDINCICSNSGFLSGIACCLAATCSEADQKAAVVYAEDICKTNGVTNLPPSVTCDSTTSQAATTSATAAGGAPTAASTTATTTGTATGSSTSGGATQSTTASSGSSPTSSGSSSSAAPSSSSNAAPQNVAVMGAGLVGGLAAVAALL